MIRHTQQELTAGGNRRETYSRRKRDRNDDKRLEKLFGSDCLCLADCWGDLDIDDAKLFVRQLRSLRKRQMDDLAVDLVVTFGPISEGFEKRVSVSCKPRQSLRFCCKVIIIIIVYGLPP